jgi:hypothetical protein
MEDSWSEIKIPQFDELTDDLFKLCVAIGRILHQRDYWNIVFKFQSLDLFDLLGCLAKMNNINCFYTKESRTDLANIQKQKPCVVLIDKTKGIPLDILNGNCVEIWEPTRMSCYHWTIPTFINDPNNVVNGKAAFVIKGKYPIDYQIKEKIPLYKLAYKCTLAYLEVIDKFGSHTSDALFEFFRSTNN